MSSGQDEDRAKINALLYPNTKLKINIFNDANWPSDQNLGMLDPIQLNDVLNTYNKFIDLSSQPTLEAQACGISPADISGDIKQAIEDNILAPVAKLENRTYDYFNMSMKFYHIYKEEYMNIDLHTRHRPMNQQSANYLEAINELCNFETYG